MSYHNGSSSSSSRSSNSSNSSNSSQSSNSASSAKQSAVNTQRQVAPPGYHYMPDGRLMADNDPSMSSSSRDSGCYGGFAGKIKANSSAKSGIPVFRICSYNLVTTYGVTTEVDGDAIPVIYDASNTWMISAWSDSVMGILYPSSFINYFNQIVAQTGPLVPGDRIAMDNNVLQPRGTTWSNGGGVCLSSISDGAALGIANKFCLEYLGDYVPTNYPPNYPSVPIGNYSWDGRIKTTTASNHIFSKFDCCKSFRQLPPPPPPSTWDCVPINTSIGEVSPDNLFNTFGISQCLERFAPQVGAFPTQQACVASCGSGGPTFPDGGALPRITNLDLDLSDLPATSESRSFSIYGDYGAEFKLEIKDNTTGYYYNFVTNVFQTTVSSLEASISGGRYNGKVVFPEVTGGSDQYDVYLYAKPSTEHATYNEVRFSDGSLDINSSTGSNSLMMQKVIYQSTALTLTLAGYSPNSTVAGTLGTSTISINKGKSQAKTAFVFKTTAGATAAYRLLKQPVESDVLFFVEPVIGAAPMVISGENIYPAITTAVDSTTDGGTTVNGSSTGTTVTTHVVSSTIATVGDRVLGNAALAAATVTVETVSGANTFTISEAISIADDLPLSFSNRMNYRWPINSFGNTILDGMIMFPATNVTTDSSVAKYQDTIVEFEGTTRERTIFRKKIPAIDTLGLKPTVLKGVTSVQAGAIVFDKQQPLALAGDTVQIGGYGVNEVLRLYGWEIRLTDLAVALTAPTTTTTEATAAHATIAVADKEGVINNFSRVGGIGVNPALQNPLITSGGGADGAGDWIMDAVQTLENGITLTVENTGRIATITGNIEIIKAGVANQTIRFDLEKILSTSAPS